MSTPPSHLDYAGSATPATKPRGQLGWMFLALSTMSLLATACMVPITFSASGWDLFAYVIVDRVLLVPQAIALAATAWYASNPRRRTRIVVLALATSAGALMVNLVMVVMSLR